MSIPVGVLGATGMVGQRFVQLLADHPLFELTEVAASDRSAGKPYREACRWVIPGEMPAIAANLVVKECAPGLDCRLVFSGLPAEIAGDVELAFAAAGYAVSSNARNHRMVPDVPLLIPEVNPDHVGLIDVQRRNRGYGSGFIVTNPNCSTIHAVLALKPIHDAFGLRKVIVTTMQALSGAGYPGVASLDVLDNVIPYIGGEEEKMETEPLKLFGRLQEGRVEPAAIAISAQCNRVHVQDGHLEAISVELERRASPDEVKRVLQEFVAAPQKLGLPSAPRRPVIVRDEPDRPQPRRDRDVENGMASVVGRVRRCPILDVKFLVLGHNTIRGAAGGAILNAELLHATRYLE